MKREELKAIRERCDAAPEGPWEADGYRAVCVPGFVDGSEIVYEDNNQAVYDSCTDPGCDCVERARETAAAAHDFIARARTDVPKLLAIAEAAIRLSEPLTNDDGMYRCAYCHADKGVTPEPCKADCSWLALEEALDGK